MSVNLETQLIRNVVKPSLSSRFNKDIKFKGIHHLTRRNEISIKQINEGSYDAFITSTKHYDIISKQIMREDLQPFRTWDDLFWITRLVKLLPKTSLAMQNKRREKGHLVSHLYHTKKPWSFPLEEIDILDEVRVIQIKLMKVLLKTKCLRTYIKNNELIE